MWRQLPLDLTKDSHTQHKEPPKTWLGFFLLYLRQNIKPYTLNPTRYTSFDQSSLIFYQSSQADLHSKSCRTLDSNFTYKHTLSKSKTKTKTFWSWFVNITNWSSNTFKPKVLEPNKLPLWQSVTKHKLKQKCLKFTKTTHYKNITQHNKFNLTTIY